MALPKQHKVATRDIGTVFRGGAIVRGSFLTLRYVLTQGEVRSVAIVVPRATASLATARNRLRRQVSEALQPFILQMKKGFRAVFTITNAHLPVREELAREVLALLVKSGIVSK